MNSYIFEGKKILLGVTGSIAAYKACDLLREFQKNGAQVHVMMSANAGQFVSALTFQALSGNPVLINLFDSSKNFPHLDREINLVVIAPATANILAKFAYGLADEVISTSVLGAKCPVLIVPAMNPMMWENKIVQNNVRQLKSAGYHVLDPGIGEVACGEYGEGHFPEISEIVFQVKKLLTKQDLKGKKILITAGPTVEPIDPVRHISNIGTGAIGFALAEEAVLRGAKVEVVCGPTLLTLPRGTAVYPVKTAKEMFEVSCARAKNADVVIGTAAVADYRPEKFSTEKIKKNSKKMTLSLVQNQDILKEIAKKKEKKVLIGFALETDNVLGNARKKLKEKNLDLVIANTVPADYQIPSRHGIQMTFITADSKISFPYMEKRQAAQKIMDWIRKKFRSVRLLQ